MDLALAAAGLFVGFLVGLTGVGGGSLMAPLLILLFGFHPAVAVGTDLWFAAITKSVGAVVHRRLGSPDWRIVIRLAASSVPVAVLTVLWLGWFHSGRLESDILLILLGAALVATALLLPLKGRLHQPLIRLRERFGANVRTHQLLATVVGGAIIGCLVTLTSIGAGALVAVLLMMVYPLRLNAKAVVGTDIVHAVPLALVAAIGHSWLGNVDWVLLIQLLIGSVPGIIVGSLASGKINEVYVRGALAVMLAVSGFKLITG